MTNKQVEKERVLTLILLQQHSSLKEIREEAKQGRILEAGARAGPCRAAAYCLTSHGFLCLLPYRNKAHESRESTMHNGLGTLYK